MNTGWYTLRALRLRSAAGADGTRDRDAVKGEAEPVGAAGVLSGSVNSMRRRIGIGIAVAIAYLIAARFGFRLAFVAEQVTTVWAPSGIGLAALVLWGPALWPAIWVGAFAANAGSTAPLWSAAAVATGNTLEAVAGAWMLRRLHVDPKLRRLRDVVAFIVAGAALSTIVSATLGVSTLCAAGVQRWDRFDLLWREWWLGDAVGALIVAPVILTAARHTRSSPLKRIETWALVGAAILATHVVFGQVFGVTGAHHPLEYVIFPFIVTAALRGGPPGTSLVILAAAAVAIGNTARGAGPFAETEVHNGLIQLQAFMGILAGTGLLLAAAIAERETGERRRAAAAAVGEILSASRDLATVAPAVLQGICVNLDWQVGALWLVDRAANRLRCVALWGADGLNIVPFETAARERVFTPGFGLPGQVWASGRATWMENVLKDANFRRRDAARQAGVRGAFALPICLGDDVLGVIECFRETIEPPDPDLLQTLSTVGNQVGQFIARTRDLAARQQAERDREELLRREATARSEAEAANRAKDEFLATLSHELRTPLNAIVGWTRMLQDRMLDPAATRRALEVIDRNAQLQAQLVDDILDVSGIVSGKLRLERSPVDLGAIVGAALDAVRPAADAKQVRLDSRMRAASPTIEADHKRLQQVVWNLLSNAVKFCEPQGFVSVDIDDAEPDRVRIRVQDDGAGIEPAFLPYVFERFRQGDGSVSRRYGGLGLGLAIVRHLIELHDGTVSAESPGIGLGSTFTIELPRQAAAAFPATASSP
jgi:signal transduction histidine kinase/integral membrane sensor domain MASE1